MIILLIAQIQIIKNAKMMSPGYWVIIMKKIEIYSVVLRNIY